MSHRAPHRAMLCAQGAVPTTAAAAAARACEAPGITGPYQAWLTGARHGLMCVGCTERRLCRLCFACVCAGAAQSQLRRMRRARCASAVWRHAVLGRLWNHAQLGMCAALRTHGWFQRGCCNGHSACTLAWRGDGVAKKTLPLCFFTWIHGGTHACAIAIWLM